ncbi:MAG: type II toxin-antitoxin system VapB family antitoxin [Truepera sp.]|nr:type II toxin-antitoxin system VapB family antitoxin [Truepera sp.]
MATNLHIDEKLLSEAQRLGRFKPKKETVNEALKAFIEHQKQLDVLKLQGQIDYDDDYDYQQLRQRQ